MSFTLQSHHPPYMITSCMHFYYLKRRLNEVRALYTVKHFCNCSHLQSQFLLIKEIWAKCLTKVQVQLNFCKMHFSISATLAEHNSIEKFGTVKIN
ncbi:hypothetical protein T10_12663 [Trichinella papuae]|uniref:Uncharacterized protein n=1 Tax=Trichinella papuae TaxID=268474 RepID=A0A0V1MZ02_9BILA|nr:hypothetical protein T10_12663 [Trichinella papuae]